MECSFLVFPDIFLIPFKVLSVDAMFEGFWFNDGAWFWPAQDSRVISKVFGLASVKFTYIMEFRDGGMWNTIALGSVIWYTLFIMGVVGLLA